MRNGNTEELGTATVAAPAAVKSSSAKGYGKTMKQTLPFSSKPCDIAYRLRRAEALAVEVQTFVNSLDPRALPDGITDEVLAAAMTLQTTLLAAQAGAPAVKHRVQKA